MTVENFEFCSSTANVWQFVGTLLLVFKIVLPILLIVIGIISLGKAVISDDDKDLKKCLTLLIKKVITAVCIFFIPAFVTAIFGLLRDFQDVRADYNVCRECITHPNGASCSRKVLALNEIDE